MAILSVLYKQWTEVRSCSRTDAWLHSLDHCQPPLQELEGSGVRLVPVQRNLVDLVWEERPSQPAEPVFPHPVSLCGQL